MSEGQSLLITFYFSLSKYYDRKTIVTQKPVTNAQSMICAISKNIS